LWTRPGTERQADAAVSIELYKCICRGEGHAEKTGLGVHTLGLPYGYEDTFDEKD
jgi:hypothetical protein